MTVEASLTRAELTSAYRHVPAITFLADMVSSCPFLAIAYGQICASELCRAKLAVLSQALVDMAGALEDMKLSCSPSMLLSCSTAW